MVRIVGGDVKKEIGLIPLKKELTMDSRDIATLCSKRHDHVIRDIRKMFNELAVPKNGDSSSALKSGDSLPNYENELVERYERHYKDASGKDNIYYLLPEVECLTLVSGYSAKLREQIIKEWLFLRKRFSKTRQKSIDARNEFTDMLHDRGYEKPHEYIQTTRQMKKALNITNKKEQMTEKELAKVTMAECLSELMLTDEYGYHDVNPRCVDASQSVEALIRQKIKERLIAKVV